MQAAQRETSADTLPDQVVALVRAGDTVLWPQGTGEPTMLVETLMTERHRIGSFSVFIGMANVGSVTKEHTDCVTVMTTGGTLTNHALREQQQVIPTHVSQIPRLIDQGRIAADVVLLKLARHRATGVLSMGPVADWMHEAMGKARVVIAEVGEGLPFMHGDTIVDEARLDLVVPSAAPWIPMDPVEPDPTSLAVAAFIAERVPDGATIQLGLGGIPAALVDALGGKRDLGVHSGMISDAVMKLAQQGVITGGRKGVDRGKITTGAAFGSAAFYDWVDDNPDVEVRRLTHMHDPAVISALAPLVSINSAIEVDLTGQVNAEVVGDRYLGAIGGHNDFVRYGARSPGGASIVAVSATAKSGGVSRIVPRLNLGTVTTSRADVDLVVSEFGVAELAGKTLAARARSLIGISHPDHRAELEAFADRRDAEGWL